MKTKIKTGRSPKFSGSQLLTKSSICITLLLSGLSLNAQTGDSALVKPSWWFGAAVGANFNFYQGSTQKLNEDLTLPAAFHSGNGVGLFLGPLVEYHQPESNWGIMFQAAYDGRSGNFNEVKSPCNCPMDLSTKLSYIAIEPNLRFAPFKSNLYFYAGPRLAFLMNKSFNYTLKPNTEIVGQEVANTEVSGDLSDMKTTLLSMQIGAGYDIPLSHSDQSSQFVLSPFIAFQPYFGQSPRSIETWNIATLRAGVALKFGRSHSSDTMAQKPIKESAAALAPVPAVYFSVYAPKNVPTERRVRETFPIRNYVFFDLGSSKIPSRYVLLKKEQVKDFKEDQLEVFKPKRLSGRSNRQMVAYYNILNILGDRMQKNPSTKIVLVGASEKGEADALAMANSIKLYLMDVFAIDGTRIALEGRLKPKHPSEQPGGTKELTLLRQGDHRVTIESASPTLLMEFQSGQDVPLKPIELSALQVAPIDSYVIFTVDGASENLKYWNLEVKDDKGKVQYFGPYTQSKVSLPGKAILGTRPEGDYKIMMIGKQKNGETITKETTAHMVLWTPSKREEGMRFSILFDFNESDATKAYEKYLTEVVAPKIPVGAKVIIHGHTDVIGDENYNRKLSMERTKEVRTILESALNRSGKTGVIFEEQAFGEDVVTAPFENNSPEERFYNRTVIVDIIPKE